MLLRVQYPNETYDYVSAATLDGLIGALQIRQFYRPSEKGWVDIVKGPVREKTVAYTGLERRLAHTTA